MFYLLLLSLILTAKPAFGEGPVFDFLIFDPEDLQPYPIRTTSPADETEGSNVVQDESGEKPPSLSKIPSKFFKIRKRDTLVLELENVEPSTKFRWILNGITICELNKCKLDTHEWTSGAYNLFLHLENRSGFKTYKTKVWLDKPQFDIAPETKVLPLIDEESADYSSEKDGIIGKSLDGLTYLEKSNRSVNTSLGRSFFVPYGIPIRTSPRSTTLLTQVDNFHMLLINQGRLHFEKNKIHLQWGSIRVRTTPNSRPLSIITTDGLEVKTSGESDFLLSYFNGKIRLKSFISDLQIQLPKEQYRPSNERLDQLYRKQFIQEDEKLIAMRFSPGKTLVIHKEKFIISAVIHSKLKSLLSQSTPNWIQQGDTNLFPDTTAMDQRFIDEDLMILANSKMMAGLMTDASIAWRKLYRQDKKRLLYQQRIIELHLLGRDWNKVENIIKDLNETHQGQEIIQYYRGVSAYRLGHLLRAKEIFKEILWNAEKDPIITSSKQFIHYMDHNRKFRLLADIRIENNNNPISLNEDQQVPDEIFHKASPGLLLDSTLSWQIENSEVFSLRSNLDIDTNLWYRLMNYSPYRLILALDAKIATETFESSLTPYLGRSAIIKYPGLDHFGLKYTLTLKHFQLTPKISYDHSKILDTAANDDGFIDPLTLIFAESEDRSRQQQRLTLDLTINPLLLAKFKLGQDTFRADSTRDESGILLGGILQSTIIWRPRLSSILLFELDQNSMESRNDTAIKAIGQLKYRWFPSAVIGGYLGLLQHNSSEAAYSSSQLFFGVGTELEY